MTKIDVDDVTIDSDIDLFHQSIEEAINAGNDTAENCDCLEHVTGRWKYLLLLIFNFLKLYIFSNKYSILIRFCFSFHLNYREKHNRCNFHCSPATGEVFGKE